MTEGLGDEEQSSKSDEEQSNMGDEEQSNMDDEKQSNMSDGDAESSTMKHNDVEEEARS